MPGFPDKIIINHGGGRGTAALIEEDMAVLERLGREILDLAAMDPTFLLADFNDLRDKLKAACDDHYASDMKYHAVLRELIAETAKRIDAKVCP